MVVAVVVRAFLLAVGRGVCGVEVQKDASVVGQLDRIQE